MQCVTLSQIRNFTHWRRDQRDQRHKRSKSNGGAASEDACEWEQPFFKLWVSLKKQFTETFKLLPITHTHVV